MKRRERRAYMAAYRDTNRERVREHNRTYYASHREKIRVKQSAYYEEHREERLAAQHAYIAEHREEKRERDRAYNEDHKEERRKQALWFTRWLTLLKSTQGCSDCGTHEGWLEYHHIDPTTKLYQISGMATHSEETFLDEVAKCTVLCRSCHKNRHVMMKEAVAMNEEGEQ